MNQKILVWPNQKLRKVSESVDSADSVSGLIKDLIDTCNVAMGAGLAAPQIGVAKQVAVIRPKVFGLENPDPSEYNSDYMVMINPSWEPQGEEIQWKEGCLSLPGVEGNVTRKEHCLLKYTTETGEERRMIAEWPFSGGIQHECDHLLGKLFIHRMEKKKAAFLLERHRRKKRKALIKAKRARKGIK